MIILVNLIALLLVVWVVWWFWLYKPKAVQLLSTGHVKVTVENGVYTPDVINAPVGIPLEIEFELKDSSHCAATVSFPDLNISSELSMEHPQTVTITPDKQGEFEFTCPMGMYKGKVIVTAADQIASESIVIIVDGGIYQPEALHIPVGSPVTLKFLRKDESHCAATVVFNELGISQEIPVNEPTEIEITIEQPGTYSFSCPMGMYQGKLIAK